MKKRKVVSLVLAVAALGITGGLLTGCSNKKAAETVESSTKVSESTEETATSESTHSHSHSHSHSEISQGIFEDSDVQNRELSDWAGDWQSVYPYLQDGSLDEVLQAKAESGEKTFEEYKAYYEEGYKTTVERIVITKDSFEFYENGTSHKGKYKYDGFEILTYESGKKGVRYKFTLTDNAEGMPKYIQFSDHGIEPAKAEHFHLYWGDESQEALYQQLTNWPTYYPADLSAAEIVHEMSAH